MKSLNLRTKIGSVALKGKSLVSPPSILAVAQVQSEIEKKSKASSSAPIKANNVKTTEAKQATIRAGVAKGSDKIKPVIGGPGSPPPKHDPITGRKPKVPIKKKVR